jgi:hypothetical protein
MSREVVLQMLLAQARGDAAVLGEIFYLLFLAAEGLGDGAAPACPRRHAGPRPAAQTASQGPAGIQFQFQARKGLI